MLEGKSVNRFPKTGSESRLRELDGWRAISVLAVVQQHALVHQHGMFLSHHPHFALWEHYIGALAVKVFFVISGFVICRLLIGEERRYGQASLAGFYYRRVFRIIPPFALYLGTVWLLVSLGLIVEPRQALLAATFFLSDIHFWEWGRFVGHIWSLAVEEQFYLTFPLIFVLTSKRWRSFAILTCALAFMTWNLSMIFTGWETRVSGETRAGFICISCGVMMALFEDRARRLAARVPAFAVAVLGLVLILHPVASESWQGDLYESLLVPPAICLILLFSLERDSWVRTVLCLKPCQAVGITSYGIYLWQQFFTVPVWCFPLANRFLPFMLPLLAIIVPLSYFLIEKPAMRYGKSLSRRRRERLSQAVATA